MDRDPFCDNAKFLLMALVVYGHAIEPLIGTHPALKCVYVFIYLFHMPCFVVLAGALTKVRPGWPALTVAVRRLLVPYVVFQLLSWVFRWGFSPGGAGGFTLLTPDWVLWFLVSLFWWRALLPVFVAVPFGLPLAVGLGLAAGVVDGIGAPLSLSRTAVFFPFFLAGHLVGRQRLTVLEGRGRVAVGAGLLAAVVAAWAVCGAGIDVRWLYGSTSYARLGASPINGILVRGGLYLVGVVAVLGFLAIVPRGATRFTSLGANSLYPFLLHGFVIRFADWHGWFGVGLPSVVWAVLLLLLSVALTVGLSSPLIRRVTASLVEPGHFQPSPRPTA